MAKAISEPNLHGTEGTERTERLHARGRNHPNRISSGAERRRAAMSSPAPLPVEIHQSAQQGELRKVVKWLREGGSADAFGSAPTRDGRATTETLLHAASGRGYLEMVKELLKHGASIDLQSSLGLTALMAAACAGHLPIVLVLLQHLADPDQQDMHGQTALMWAVGLGQEACVRALLRAKANTELLDQDGRSPLLLAEAQGHTAIADLIRQHAAPPLPAATSPTTPPDADEPTPLPIEIFQSAKRGELQKVVKWLGKGGMTNALCSAPAEAGQTLLDAASGLALLHGASSSGHVDIVRELLNRGASVDLPGRFGATPLMAAAGYGHLPTVHVLLQHSANPDLQCNRGYTALMLAEGQEECVQALLQAKANTKLLNGDGRTALLAKTEGHATTAPLGLAPIGLAAGIQQHARGWPPVAASPAAASPAAPPDAGEPAESAPASLPVEIFRSAERGELQKVVKWLGKGEPADTPCSAPVPGSHLSSHGLLHAATGNGHLEMVRMLLKRGASVDLQTNLGFTALMSSAGAGHPSILLVLLEHSADPDLQDIFGATALMAAAGAGQGACVQALLRAKANTELLDNDGDTALKHAKRQGNTAIAGLIRRHLAAAASSSGGPAAPQATQAEQAVQAARANTAMKELLAEEAAEQAKTQASPKTSKKKKKAGRAAAAGDEPSEAPSAATLVSSPAAAPKRAEAGLRAAISGGGLSALEAALAAAPRKVREGSVGAEAQAWCSRLLEAQQEAEREVKQEAAREAAKEVWLWVRNFARTSTSPSPQVPPVV